MWFLNAKFWHKTNTKKWRHDTICQIIHRQLCKDNGLDHSERWYEHRPDAVTENESVKLLWDMQIQTDKVLEHSRPDIVLMDKAKRSVKIIDIACSFDTRVVEKEQAGEDSKISRPEMGAQKNLELP